MSSLCESRNFAKSFQTRLGAEERCGGKGETERNLGRKRERGDVADGGVDGFPERNNGRGRERDGRRRLQKATLKGSSRQIIYDSIRVQIWHFDVMIEQLLTCKSCTLPSRSDDLAAAVLRPSSDLPFLSLFLSFNGEARTTSPPRPVRRAYGRPSVRPRRSAAAAVTAA